MGGRSTRFLSEEEIELWAHVTRHDKPLARPQPAVCNGGASNKAAGRAPVPALKNGEDAAGAKRAVAAPPSKPPQAPPHAPFDPRISKRLARGRHPIEARLDLHGLRQQDAYAVLRRFLARCQADGLRHVLVITGKGGKPDEADVRDFWRSDERGVLRKLVPQWLAEPSFRLHVVSFTESAMKHGGNGALYVTIRKGPRRRLPS